MSSCSCFFPLLLLLFLLLCFLLFITYVILFFLPFFPASLHVSRLIVLAVVVLVIIPPLSQLVFLLLPRPPARIWTGKQWTKKQIILFAFRGSLRKCPFTESLFLFSLVDFFHPQNMFLFHVLGLSFEGVRDSLLLHSFLFFFVFGVWHTTFFRSNLSLVLAFFGFVVFFVRALPFFCVSACVVFLLWVLVCFLSILVVILGLSFLDCSVLMLFLLLRVLAARCVCVCVCVFLGCLFRGTITESRMGMANREGSIYFSGFLIIGVFGWKQPLSPRATLFSKWLSLKNPASKRWKRTPVFNFVAGNAIKIGVPEMFFWRNKVIHDYLRFWFFFIFCWLEIIQLHAFGGSSRKGCLTWKTLQK